MVDEEKDVTSEEVEGKSEATKEDGEESCDDCGDCASCGGCCGK